MIGDSDGKQYENEFDLLVKNKPFSSSTVPPSDTEKPAGELNPTEPTDDTLVGTQYAMDISRKGNLSDALRKGELGGGGFAPPMAKAPERITSAAIKDHQGTVYKGPNHTLITMDNPKLDLDKPFIDGFLTSSGRFVDRMEAARIVRNNGQERSEFYKDKRSSFILGTEDLKDLLKGSNEGWKKAYPTMDIE